MVGLAVLLPREVSLTCWLGWVLTLLGSGLFFMVTGDAITDPATHSIHCGMYVGLVAFLVFVGWREYLRILRCAVTFRRAEDPALRDAAIACRLFIAAFIALVGLLTYAGLYWLLALSLACSLVLILVVMARITAEIGIPWLLNFWGMARFFSWKALGPAAFGTHGLAVAAIVFGVLDLYPANTLAANETTYRKLEELQPRGLPRWRYNLVLLVAACVAVAATLFAHLWNNYSFGGRKERVTRVHFLKLCVDKTGPDIRRLQLEGRTEGLAGARTWREKLGLIKSAPKFWQFFAFGALVVAACGFLRLRFAWWPFHPLPLLFFNTWVMSRLWVSFLIGWVIKTFLARVCGARTFVRSKPFFVGLILGQLFTNCVWVAVNILHHHIYASVPPPPYTLL